jgi:hypothetical protein
MGRRVHNPKVCGVEWMQKTVPPCEKRLPKAKHAQRRCLTNLTQVISNTVLQFNCPLFVFKIHWSPPNEGLNLSLPFLREVVETIIKIPTYCG